MAQDERTFKCDKCEQLIKKPEDGFLEWDYERDGQGGGRALDFRIVHKFPVSCFHFNYRSEHLELFLGDDGMALMLGLLNRDGGTADVASWTRAFYRLHIPNFEKFRNLLEKEDGEWNYRQQEMLEALKNRRAKEID